jgi:hypothetical protein
MAPTSHKLFTSAVADSSYIFTSEPLTNATIQNFLPTFVYHPRILLIAYGTAISLSMLCLVCGLAAIYSNGVTYTNNFSTIVRMTRDKRFDSCIENEEDTSGADPLPEHIGDLLVEYIDGERGSTNRGMGDGVGLKIIGGF